MKFLEPIIPERIRRLEQVCEYAGHQYKRNKTEDKWELQNSVYSQKYPDQIQRELKTLIRTRIPRGQYELDPQGTIDEKGIVKEALVYSIQERVVDPKNPQTNILSSCSTKMGVYKRPFFSEERDDLGNIVTSSIRTKKTMFFIEFTEENARKVLEEFNYEYKGLALGIASQGSSEPWYGQHTYTVYNLEEWLHEDFDDLIEANQKGFLRKGEEHGVKRFIKDKAERRERARAEFEEFKAQNKSNKKTK